MAGGKALKPESLAQPIDAIEAFTVRVPLEAPLMVFGVPITTRDFVFVRATAGRYSGIGYGLTRGGAIDRAVRDQLALHALGQPLSSIRQIWQRARNAVRMIGEQGIYARALAVLDIALWDLLGQSLQQPLWRVLGGAQSAVPCLAIMGYYRQSDDVATLRSEAQRLVAAGYTRFKIPFGADSERDRQRVAALRAVVGSDALIALDAGAAFTSPKAAIAAWESVAEYHPAFLEDPFAESAWEMALALAQQTRIPVAFGESIAAPGILQRLGRAGGIDILRPDVTHQMGVTGYLQGTAVAYEMGTRIFPHYFPDLHAVMLAAVGGEMIEESPRAADTVGFWRLRATQPDIHDGMWHLTERPGFGIDWDEDALARHTLMPAP